MPSLHIRPRALAGARAAPMVRALAIVAMIAAVGIAGCGGDDDSGPATFDDDAFPLTFEYPGSLEISDEVDFSQELGGAADESVAIGIDGDNALILQRFTLNAEIDEESLGLVKQELDGLMRQVDTGAPAGAQGEVAGFPSVTYDAVSLPVPEEGESRFVALFDGNRQYLLNCQSTPDFRDEIERACDQALETLARD